MLLLFLSRPTECIVGEEAACMVWYGIRLVLLWRELFVVRTTNFVLVFEGELTHSLKTQKKTIYGNCGHPQVISELATHALGNLPAVFILDNVHLMDKMSWKLLIQVKERLFYDSHLQQVRQFSAVLFTTGGAFGLTTL